MKWIRLFIYSNPESKLNGAYDQEAKTIKINIKDPANISEKDIKNTLIHELQHAIQNIEGFARGSSPSAERMKMMYERGRKNPARTEADKQKLKDEAYKNYRQHYGEGEARTAQKRLDYYVDGEDLFTGDDWRKANMPEDDFDYDVDDSIIEFDEYSSARSSSSNVRYSMASKLDPSKVTSDDVVDLLERVKETEFNLGTYIPVRADTPNIVIESAQNRLGLNIPNLPMIMNVGKAFDAMEEKTNTKASQSETRHTHGLSPYLLVDILKKLDKPKFIFYQKDNGYITEFVTVRDINNNKVHAVIDFYKAKPANKLNGYYGGIFNVVVTLLDRSKKVLKNT